MDVPHQIETGRLILRRPEIGDWFAVNNAVNESFEELKPWMGWAQERPTMDVSEDQVHEAMMRWEYGLEYRMYMIEKSTGKFVGSTGFIHPDPAAGSLEIGYWCRTSMSGNGFVTEAVRALTDLALEIGELAVIKCDINNKRSISVATKLGYSYDYLYCSGKMVFTKKKDG